MRARTVFEGDSIANIAHQLGYFDVIGTWRVLDTLAERIEGVTIESVAAAAVLPWTAVVPWPIARPAARPRCSPTRSRSMRHWRRCGGCWRIQPSSRSATI